MDIIINHFSERKLDRMADATADNIKIKWWAVTLSHDDIASVNDALLKGFLAIGPLTAAFEEAFAAALGVPHAVAMANCSSALFSSIFLLKLKPGDEVIIPARTFAATANSVILAGGKPILADSEHDKPVLSIDRFREKINFRTRAVIPCHINGGSPDMDAIMEIASAKGIKVIEDSAQSFYSKDSKGRFLGTIGFTGCFSFGITKLLTTGIGGMAVTSDSDTAMELRRLRNHGVINYSDGFHSPGFNFKFSDILASIGISRLKGIEKTVQRHIAIYRMYSDGLSSLNSIKLIPADVDSETVPLWIEAVADDRDKLISYLALRGIEAIPLLKSLEESNHLRDGSYPNAMRFSTNGVRLPSGPAQTDIDINCVIREIQNFDKTC